MIRDGGTEVENGYTLFIYFYWDFKLSLRLQFGVKRGLDSKQEKPKTKITYESETLKAKNETKC